MENNLSLELLREFEEHPVWRELVATVQERIELLRLRLETGKETFNMGGTQTGVRLLSVRDWDDIKGELSGMRNILNFPETIREEILSKQIPKEGEEND